MAEEAQLSERQVELLVEAVKLALSNPEFAQQLAAAAALAHLMAMKEQYPDKFKAMFGAVAKPDAITLGILKEQGLDLTSIWGPDENDPRIIGVSPFPGTPQTGANAACFYSDDKNQVYILLGRKGDKWSTPQGFSDALTPTMDEEEKAKADKSVEDTLRRELREEAGVDIEAAGGEILLVGEYPRVLNPNGNSKTFLPHLYCVTFNDRPDTAAQSKAFEELQWVPLSSFMKDGDPNKFTLEDGREGTMANTGLGVPYLELLNPALEAYLNFECDRQTNQNLRAVTGRFPSFPEKPDLLFGLAGQAFVGAVPVAIRKVLEDRQANPLPALELDAA